MNGALNETKSMAVCDSSRGARWTAKKLRC